MSTGESTLADVCFAVSASLERHGMSAVLTGGSAAALYAPHAYMSHDADFILDVDRSLDDISIALKTIGFERIGRSRMFGHPSSQFTVDFPKGPLAIGGDYVHETAVIERDGVVAMDMWQPYFDSTIAYVPDAASKIVFDKFHITAYLTKAVDLTRRAMMRDATLDRTALKGTKYTWLYSFANLDRTERRDLSELRRRYKRLGRAWSIKENFAEFWVYRVDTTMVRENSSSASTGGRIGPYRVDATDAPQSDIGYDVLNPVAARTNSSQ